MNENFDLNSESSKAAIKAAKKAATDANLSATRLAESADASFKFEDGDNVTIPAQVAHVVPFNDKFIKQLNDSAEEGKTPTTAYFAYTAQVERNGRSLTVNISVKQVHTNTVWLSASAIDGQFLDQKQQQQAYEAPVSEGHKRFGEWGSVRLEDGIPVLTSPISAKMTVAAAAYTGAYLQNASEYTQAHHTVVSKRENYGIAEEIAD